MMWTDSGRGCADSANHISWSRQARTASGLHPVASRPAPSGPGRSAYQQLEQV